MTTALSITATIIAILWIPILKKFFVAWRDRHNPVSLAIGLNITLMIYLSLLVVMVASFKARLLWAVGLSALFNLAACVNFYVAFHVAQKRFGNQRQVGKVEPLSAGTQPPATRPRE
jgi:peptidoglycan biosynthesis protein MviN/MurJ (putative lipid II flippase)